MLVMFVIKLLNVERFISLNSSTFIIGDALAFADKESAITYANHLRINYEIIRIIELTPQ